MNKYFIGISISELQQWLADDELVFFTDRITHSRSLLDDSLSDSELEDLLISLPSFSLDDIAGVLIVEVKGPDTWRSDDNPHIRYLKLSDVKRFIPLTDEAKTALCLNWSNVIVLSEAIFNQPFTNFRIKRKSILAELAGNLFASLFIDHGPEGFSAPKVFVDSLPRAIMASEHRKLDEIENLSHLLNDKPLETWVERVFGDIKKYDKENKLIILRKKPENIRDIAIVGLLFSTVEEVKALTDTFRHIYKRLEGMAKDHHQSLPFVYADPDLSQLNVSFNVYSIGGESISLVTLGLFLRWKHAFHDQRSIVNVPSILNDVKSLVELVDVKQVSNALWMMGAYLGMENIAPNYRHSRQSDYPALCFANNVNSLEPVIAWQSKVNQFAAGHELSPDSAKEFGVERKPEHELASESNIVANEGTLSDQHEEKHALETMQTEEGQLHATASDDIKQSTDNSCSSEPSPTNHALATPMDAHIQLAQGNTDNEDIEPPKQKNVIELSLTTSEDFSADETKISTSSSNQSIKGIEQASPTFNMISEDKTEIGCTESSRRSLPAKTHVNKSSTKKPSNTGSLRNIVSNATPSQENQAILFKTEDFGSENHAELEDNLIEREGKANKKIGIP